MFPWALQRFGWARIRRRCRVTPCENWLPRSRAPHQPQCSSYNRIHPGVALTRRDATRESRGACGNNQGLYRPRCKAACLLQPETNAPAATRPRRRLTGFSLQAAYPYPSEYSRVAPTVPKRLDLRSLTLLLGRFLASPPNHERAPFYSIVEKRRSGENGVPRVWCGKRTVSLGDPRAGRPSV